MNRYSDQLVEKYPSVPTLAVSESTDLLVELHYLPCLDFFSGLLRFGKVQLEMHEQYQKQSYRNRCYVLTANNVEGLMVPVQRGTHHVPVRELRIDSRQSWQMQHWRCLRTAYGKAPFFEYYAPYLELTYRRNWSFLVDLTSELLTICLKLLGWNVTISLTDCYTKTPGIGLFDARSVINPRSSPESYVFHRPVAYQQNFGRNFVPNLSILDLLFCQGPAASDVLRAGLRE